MKNIKQDNLIDLINKLNADLFTDNNITNNVSELKMHKILFMLFGAFYKNFKRDLFKAKFEAWRLGPVEINYRKKKELLGFCLQTEEEKKYLSNLIRILLKKSTSFLVDFTHTLDSWKNHDNQYKEVDNKIPNNEIYSDFDDIEI